ncbi:MAG: hypothetical protein R3E32_25635 [Chitinophagales bacterium]
MLSFFMNTSFKVGDSVKVKNGVKHPKIDVDLSGWQGRVVNVDGKEIQVEFDTITLNSLTNHILAEYASLEEYPILVYLQSKKLEITEERDKYEDIEAVQDRLIEKMDRKYKPTLPPRIQFFEKWTRHFQRSSFYREMEAVDKENYLFVLETFHDYMYDYEGLTPKRWTVEAMTRVCLIKVPEKITAETDVFESYGKVLHQYFAFLESRNYHSKAHELKEAVADIQRKILVRSQNQDNWGMAKTAMMNSTKGGGFNPFKPFKLTDKHMEKLEKLDGDKILSISEESDDYIFSKKQLPSKPIVAHNPYRHLKRNDLVGVKYKDGKVLEKVKFKKIEKDLVTGKCELIDK